VTENKKILDNCKNDLMSIGVKIISTRDARSLIEVSFQFEPGKENEQASEILTKMKPRDELCVDDPADGDCVRIISFSLSSTFEITRACHGCSGTGQEVECSEAAKWILEATVTPRTKSSRRAVAIYTRYI
jgi:hypothetical protein